MLAEIASVATPATLLRWYRYLIAAKYDGTKNRSPGRPPTAKDVPELMVRVARENLTWGYTRLQGALKNLGYELGRNTIKGALAEHGIAPAPERSKSMPWSTFIKAHGGAIAATDSGTRLDIRPRLGGLLHGDDPCPPKTIVEPAALGTVANTDTKLLIYGLFQKGRVLAQDGIRVYRVECDCRPTPDRAPRQTAGTDRRTVPFRQATVHATGAVWETVRQERFCRQSCLREQRGTVTVCLERTTRVSGRRLVIERLKPSMDS